MSAPLWKQKPIRDPKRLAFCRELPCSCCGATEGIQAHHEARKGDKAMGGKVGDDFTLPLCWRCHRLRHDHGRDTFWQGVDVEGLIERVNRAWGMIQNR